MEDREAKMLCTHQLSTKELATTSTEDTDRMCVCAVQAMATPQYNCAEHEADEPTIASHSFPLHKSLHTPCRLKYKSVLFFALLLSLLHSTVGQLVTQPAITQPEIPIRCMTNPMPCGLSTVQSYRYDNELGECDYYVGYHCDSRPASELNHFSSLEECQSVCMNVSTTDDPNTDDEDDSLAICFQEWSEYRPCFPDFPKSKYRYESSHNACEPFDSFNCENTDNVFASLEECQTRCEEPLNSTPTPPYSSGDGELLFPFTTAAITTATATPTSPSPAPTPPLHPDSPSLSTVVMTPSVMTTTETPQLLPSLNKFDLAIIGVGLLVLILIVALALLIVLMVCKHWRRFKINKQDVMDSRRVEMILAYRSKKNTVVVSHGALTKQTPTYFSAV